MNFQHRLFELRRKCGLSQEDLATLVGVSRQAVQKWESGSSKPDMENLSALANYFEVSLDYLIQGKEPPPPPQETTAIHHHYHRRQYEYKSKRTLLGLPLVHIHCGPGLCRAKGIIAIGNIATGLISIGGLSVGLFSLGGFSLGLLLALGGLSVGAISVGGLAAGLIAAGGIALGILSFGGVACGAYATGGVASASRVAIGGVASAPVAIGSAAKGTQTFLVPLGEQLTAAQNAIAGACQNAPAWLGQLLQKIVHFVHYYL